MHVEMIVAVVFERPVSLEVEAPKRRGRPRQQIAGYVVTLGANTDSFVSAASTATEAAIRACPPIPCSCEIDSLEIRRVSLEDWSPEAAAHFVSDPTIPGVYYQSGLVFFEEEND